MFVRLYIATIFTLSAPAQSLVLDAESYNQWKQGLKSTSGLAGAEIRAAAGFKVEQVRLAKPDEGSWIALAFDAQGRAVISREDQGLLRLPKNARADSPVEKIDDSLKEVRGLLFSQGFLFANANNGHALVRLRDADDDGVFEETKVLRETPGGVGHGRNQLAAGPDGLIYMIHGDDVRLPASGATPGSPFQNANEDRLLTSAWDKFHWSKSVSPPCGHLARTDVDGKKWEIVCGGLRNPFGIAFNGDGEPFTYDADMEWDVGLPWYRPTRILHLVSGADYGWRGASGAMPAWFPDVWPAVCDIGKGSPTAVMFGTRSNFPRPWKDALFAMDWAYGIIYAVQLTPDGASYKGKAEVFLQGRPLNVTSMDFGPDGAMYFLTGGRRTQSALYRVSAEFVAPETPQALAPRGTEARTMRRALEAFHGRMDGAAVEKAWPFLAHEDPSLRRAARVAIEAQPVAEWKARAMSEKVSAAAVEAALALARTGTLAQQPALRERLAALFPTLDAGERATALRALQLSIIRHGAPENVAALIGSLAALPALDAHGEHLLGELLVSLQSPAALPRLLAVARSAPTQEERMAAIFTVRFLKAGWTPHLRREWLAALGREQSTAKGAHHLGMTFRYARSDFEAALTQDERAALTTEFAALDPAALALPPVENRPFVKAWTLPELTAVASTKSVADAEVRVRGKAIYDSTCRVCHAHGGAGGVLGPDLTGLAGRFDRRTILESLIDPWRVVADPYRLATVTLPGGEIVAGAVVSEENTVLKIRTNPVEPDALRAVDRSTAKAVHISSLMPPGLLNTLTEQEITALLAWLEGGQ